MPFQFVILFLVLDRDYLKLVKITNIEYKIGIFRGYLNIDYSVNVISEKIHFYQRCF